MKILLLILGLMACVGCATLDSATNIMTGKESPYPSPPKQLDASPAETGILLLHAELRGKNIVASFKYNLESAIVELRKSSQRFEAGSFSKDLVVFNGLAPGSYRLIKLNGSVYKGEYWDYFECILDRESEFMFTIKAGEITCLGKITHKDTKRMDESYITEWDKSAELEIKALEKLKDKYEESPWLPMIEAKIHQARGNNP